METVLLIELAKGLERDQEDGGVTRCTVTSERYMDVIVPAGFAFRVRLARNSRERESDALLHSLLHSLHHSAVFAASRSFGPVSRAVKR